MNTPALSLKGRALKYLAAREHSRLELERKLASHAADPAELARILDELTARGFISEQRVMESVLHRRASKLGTARVLHELREKGLGDTVLAQAAEQLQKTELQRAQAVWRKKFGVAPQDAKGRARQIRFMASRGFSGDLVRRVLRAAAEEAAE